MTFLALLSGNATEARRMADLTAKRSPRFLSPVWPAMLVQFGQTDAARRMLNLPSELYFTYQLDSRSMGWNYKAGLHEVLPEFLKLYENPVQRYRAEIILRGLPDPALHTVDEALKGRAPDREGRLLALAKAWPGNEVLKLPEALKLVARLLEVPGGPEALGPVLDELERSGPLTALLPENPDEPVTAESRVINELISRRVIQGNFDILFKFFDDISKPERSGSLTQARAELLMRAMNKGLDAMKPLWAKWDDATRRRIRDKYRALYTDESLGLVMKDFGDYAHSIYLQLYWLALAAGEEKAFDEQVREPLKQQRFWITARVVKLSTAKALDTLLQPWPAGTPEAAKARSELMLKWILSDDDLPGESDLPDRWFTTVIAAGWLRAEDAMAQAEAIIAKREREGHTARNLMEIAIREKRDDVARRITAGWKTEAEKDETGSALFMLIDRLEFSRRYADAKFVIDAFTDERLKKPAVTEIVRRSILAGRPRLTVLEAAARGASEAGKVTAALLKEKPDDYCTWKGVAMAWYYLGRESAATDHGEAQRRHAFAWLAWRIARKLDPDTPDADYGKMFQNAWTEESNALKRDPKQLIDFAAPDAASRLAGELAPWLSFLPEGLRKKLVE
jgi:hypothetical protein